MSVLRFATGTAWAAAVLADFDAFLKDHAAAEKKASGMAISMISHYPDRIELVNVMTDLAIEELTHYREVIKWLHQRSSQLGADIKDPYIVAMRDAIRRGPDVYLLDRLITGGIIEARGAERFGLVAEALTEGQLKKFYQAIANSEKRHYDTFVDLAYLYFERAIVDQRIDQLLDIEAHICAALPIRAALH
jgi:tRNA 2-(methylsulfanyl)-N6-isopentenyladenosine37 hydroxylase